MNGLNVPYFCIFMKNALTDIHLPDSDEPQIEIIGAREHNLKNIDLTIPRQKLVVFTGLSGSGKSSLAFDTIFAEGQEVFREFFSLCPSVYWRYETTGCRQNQRIVAGNFN